MSDENSNRIHLLKKIEPLLTTGYCNLSCFEEIYIYIYIIYIYIKGTSGAGHKVLSESFGCMKISESGTFDSVTHWTQLTLDLHFVVHAGRSELLRLKSTRLAACCIIVEEFKNAHDVVYLVGGTELRSHPPGKNAKKISGPRINK